MRAVIQRVSEASVMVEEKLVSKIGSGLLILLGIEAKDTPEDIKWLSGKIARLRIFNDQTGVMNNSLLDVDGNAIVDRLEYDLGKKIGKGIFGADMKVALLNDGPVTIIIDTKNKE